MVAKNKQKIRFLFYSLFVFIVLPSCVFHDSQKDRLEDFLRTAKRLSEKGLLKKSLAKLKQAKKGSPANPEINLYMGSLYIKLEDYKKAKRFLKLSNKKIKNNYDVYFLLGEAFRGLDNYAEAIFYYRKAKEIKPRKTANLKALAWSYYKIRYYKQSLKILKPLMKKRFVDEQVYIIMARVYCKLKLFKRALSVLNKGKLISDEKYKPYFLSIQGDVYFGFGKINKAKKLYKEALKIQPLLSGALLGLGRCLFEEGKEKQAVVHMEQARRLKPKMAEIYFLLARSYEGLNIKKSLRYYYEFKKLAHADPEFLGILHDVKKKISLLEKETTL